MAEQFLAQPRPENTAPAVLEPTRALHTDALFADSHPVSPVKQGAEPSLNMPATSPGADSTAAAPTIPSTSSAAVESSWFADHKDRFSVDVNLTSYHLNREAKKEYNWNERNYGLGLEYELSKDSSVLVGQYRNSIHKDTHYALYSWTPLHAGPVNFGVMAGTLDGYYYNHGGFIPAAIPTATIETKHFGVRTIFIPPMEGVKSAVVGLQVSYKPWAK